MSKKKLPYPQIGDQRAVVVEELVEASSYYVSIRCTLPICEKGNVCHCGGNAVYRSHLYAFDYRGDGSNYYVGQVIIVEFRLWPTSSGFYEWQPVKRDGE